MQVSVLALRWPGEARVFWGLVVCVCVCVGGGGGPAEARGAAPSYRHSDAYSSLGGGSLHPPPILAYGTAS